MVLFPPNVICVEKDGDRARTLVHSPEFKRLYVEIYHSMSVFATKKCAQRADFDKFYSHKDA